VTWNVLIFAILAFFAWSLPWCERSWWPSARHEGIGLVAAFVGDHERRDAGDVGLEREHHQVAHQLDVLLVARGHAGGLRDAVRDLDLGEVHRALEPLLDVVDRRHVLVELALVLLADLRVDVLIVFADAVDDALAPRLHPGALGRRAAAEEAVEDGLGLTSLGSGCVADLHDIVDEYTQL